METAPGRQGPGGRCPVAQGPGSGNRGEALSLFWPKSYKFVCARAYIYTYTHTHIHTYTHIHIHLHTYTWGAHTRIGLPAGLEHQRVEGAPEDARGRVRARGGARGQVLAVHQRNLSGYIKSQNIRTDCIICKNFFASFKIEFVKGARNSKERSSRKDRRPSTTRVRKGLGPSRPPASHPKGPGFPPFGPPTGVVGGDQPQR